MTTKHDPVPLPINLYAVGLPDVQPLDLTKLEVKWILYLPSDCREDHHSVHLVKYMPQKYVTEFLYT